LRNKLIRDHAVSQTVKPLPALRVNLDEQLPAFNPTPVLELAQQSPHLKEFFDENPLLLEALKSTPKKKSSSQVLTAKEYLTYLSQNISKDPSEARVQRLLISALKQVVDEQDKIERFQQSLREGSKSHVDSDWSILEQSAPEFVATVRPLVSSLRKLYSPVVIDTPATSESLPDKQIHFLLGVQKKLDKQRLQRSEELVNEIKFLVKYLEDTDEYFKQLHELRNYDDISHISPEANEEYVKHLLNQNWMFDPNSKQNPLL